MHVGQLVAGDLIGCRSNWVMLQADVLHWSIHKQQLVEFVYIVDADVHVDVLLIQAHVTSGGHLVIRRESEGKTMSIKMNNSYNQTISKLIKRNGIYSLDKSIQHWNHP